LAKRFSAADYVAGILSADRVMLSRSITLVESTLLADQELAQQVIGQVLPRTGNSVRVGITGVPGVGKSTFIEAFGKYAIEEQGRKLAVLAVDPSSQRSGGSILGDKTRMETLSRHPQAYVRPSPAGKSLGGVTRSTREAILLCEAAGFDLIFVETVGVGQSETAVHGMVDFFLLLLLAGAGDELQGIKRGIMEMADAIAITKADGDNLSRARQARAEYQAALHLFPPHPAGWVPEVKECSALANTGMAELWHLIKRYLHLTRQNNYFDARRKEQRLRWMHETIRQALEERFYTHPEVQEMLPALEQQVKQGQTSAFAAAARLLQFKNL
jgi:LAO/AO transport system kinase